MKGAVFATRGCPHNCRYCNLKQIYHNCFRTRPVKDVGEEIRRLPSRFFVFWDDNLFADVDYAKKLFLAIAPYKRKWAAQATLRDCKDEELLALAKAAGCIYLFIGLESFSEASLSDAGNITILLIPLFPSFLPWYYHNVLLVQLNKSEMYSYF